MGTSHHRRGRSPAPRARKARRKGGGGRTVIVALGTLAVVGLAVFMGIRMVDRIRENRANDQILASELFYEGVSVDGIALGGLTRDQARTRIGEKQARWLETVGVSVTDPEGGRTVLPLSGLPGGACVFDTEAVLERAWQQGRDQADEAERLAYIEQLPENPVALSTRLTAVDPSSLEPRVREMGEPFRVAPRDASFDPAAYDPAREGMERLGIAGEVPGRQVDADRLWADVRDSFSSLAFSEVAMKVDEVPAAVTAADLEANLQLVRISPITAFSSSENKKLNAANQGHTFTTRIRDHSDERLTNIRLANEAVSGAVMPGEVFSMNGRTGDRTEAQGYQVAPIDRSGLVDRGLGGGVCQVSGTLYNAAVRYGGKYEVGSAQDTSRPGLAITERDSHSLPSSYLATGTDATVDIGSKKDIKFRNDFDRPVYLFLYYVKAEDGTYYEHCDLYGPPLPDGATYDLLRRNVEKLEPDASIPPKTVHSKYATPGKPQYIEPRAGYTVDVYIEKTVDGQKTRAKAYTDSYKADRKSVV